MNVLVVNSKYPPEYAGSALRAHNTYIRLKAKYRINVKVLCSSITFLRSKKYTIDGIDVHRISRKLSLYERYCLDNIIPANSFISRLIRKLFKQIDIIQESVPAYLFLFRNYQWADVIHVFGNVTVTSAAITFAKITKKPIMIELVNLVDRPGYHEPYLLSLFFGWGYPKHATIVAISKLLKNNSIKIGVTKERIWCRPNPIDEQRFYYDKDNTYHDTKYIKNRNVNLLHLAKIMPLKNQLFLVDVIKHLPANFHLTIAGPLIKHGPLAERDNKYFFKIKNEILKLGFEERIKVIPGFVNNPEDLIKNSDIFLFPSKQEAFGTPVVEAIACGVPVVTSNIPGVFDQWVKNGENGYVCDLDPLIWADKIIDAVQIGEATMKAAAEEIKDRASTEVIDAEYFNRLNLIAA